MTSEDRPQRKRVYQSHHLDSTRWDGFVPRDDDIIISTPPKTGTTWTQRIVSLLVFQQPELPDTLHRISPWVDSSFIAKIVDVREVIEEQRHRRFLKSHLPLDGLPYFEKAKYICVGRDGRDAFMSLWNHYRSYTPESYALFNSGEAAADPCPRCPDDIHEFWSWWIGRGAFPWQGNGYPFGSHFEHFRDFWEFRQLPNILLVHYNDLKEDLGLEMRRIADFLEIDVPGDLWPVLVESAGFGAMKRDAEKLLPELAMVFQGGAETFLHKGTNRRWRDVLRREELAQYEALAQRSLEPALARWLEHGRKGGDPRGF